MNRGIAILILALSLLPFAGCSTAAKSHDAYQEVFFYNGQFLDSDQDVDEEALYAEITDYYIRLLQLLGVEDYRSISFPDYADIRTVSVDGVEHDFDAVFVHDDIEASECLVAIDSLIAILNSDSEDFYAGELEICQEIERRLQQRIAAD